MANPSKQKGTAYETKIVEWLKSLGLNADRLTLSGKNDRGDVSVQEWPGVVIEAKNCQRMELAKWIDEAERERSNVDGWLGVVWHHRPRNGLVGNDYVTMSGEDFTILMNDWYNMKQALERIAELRATESEDV